MSQYNYDRDPYAGRPPATANEAIEQLAQSMRSASFDNANKGGTSLAGGPPRGTSLAGGPPRGTSLAGGPPRGTSLAGGPPRGTSLAGGPPRGTSLAGGPPRGTSLAGGPPRGTSLAGGPSTLMDGQKYPLHSRTFNDAIQRAALAKRVDISNLSNADKENILDELINESVASPDTMIPETKAIVDIINAWQANNSHSAVGPYQSKMQTIGETDEGVEEINRNPNVYALMPRSYSADVTQSKVSPGFSANDDEKAASVIQQMRSSLGRNMKTSVEQSKFTYDRKTGESKYVSRTVKGDRTGALRLDDLYVSETTRNQITGSLKKTTAYAYDSRY